MRLSLACFLKRLGAILLLAFIGVPAQAKAPRPQLSLPPGLLHNAAFVEEWQRYPTPHSLLQKLKSDYPHVNQTLLTEKCRTLNAENRGFLGESDVVTGRPSVDRPSGTFMNWYLNCLAEYARQDLTFGILQRKSFHQQTDLDFYYPKSAVEFCLRQHSKGLLNSSPDVAFLLLDACSWKEFPPEVKLGLAVDLIESLVGPEDVVIDLNLARSSVELAQSLVQQVDNYNQKPGPQFGFLFTPTPEAHKLQLKQVRSMLMILINLKDVLRY